MQAERNDFAEKYKNEMDIKNMLETKLQVKEKDYEQLAVSLKNTINRLNDISNSESCLQAKLTAQKNIQTEMRRENRCLEEKVSNITS